MKTLMMTLMMTCCGATAVLACPGGDKCKCGDSCDCGDTCDCDKNCECGDK